MKKLLLLLAAGSFFCAMNATEENLNNHETYVANNYYIELKPGERIITFGNNYAVVKDPVQEKKVEKKPFMKKPDFVTIKARSLVSESPKKTPSSYQKSVLTRNDNMIFDYTVEIKTEVNVSECEYSKNLPVIDHLLKKSQENVLEENKCYTLEIPFYFQAKSIKNIFDLFVEKNKIEIDITLILDSFLFAIQYDFAEEFVNKIENSFFEALCVQENIVGFKWTYDTYVENLKSNEPDIVEKVLKHEIQLLKFLQYIQFADSEGNLIEEKIDEFYTIFNQYIDQMGQNAIANINFEELKSQKFTLRDLLNQDSIITLLNVMNILASEKKIKEQKEKQKENEQREKQKKVKKNILNERVKLEHENQLTWFEQKKAFAKKHKKPLSIIGIPSTITIVSLFFAIYSGIIKITFQKPEFNFIND